MSYCCYVFLHQWVAVSKQAKVEQSHVQLLSALSVGVEFKGPPNANVFFTYSSYSSREDWHQLRIQGKKIFPSFNFSLFSPIQTLTSSRDWVGRISFMASGSEIKLAFISILGPPYPHLPQKLHIQKPFSQSLTFID